MVSTATMQNRELQPPACFMKTQTGLLKLVSAGFHTQIISDVTFEAREEQKTCECQDTCFIGLW